MGLLDSFFGGGDQTTTQTNTPWAPLQPYILDNMKRLSELTGTREFFPGDTVADLTPEQMRGISSMMGAGEGISDFTQGSLLPAMGTYLDPGFMSPESNPWMQDYIGAATRPVTEQFTEQVLPGLRGRDRMTGATDYGSTRSGVAEGIATRGYLDTIGDISSRMWGDLYGTNVGAQQNAMRMSPMLASMMSMPASMYGSAGDIKQRQAQAEIGGERERYEYGRDTETEDLMRIISLASGMPYGTTTGVQEGQGPLSGIIGTGLMLGGLGWSPLG